MKKISYFVIFIFSFLILSTDIYASSMIEIDGYEVRFRSSNSTSSEIISVLNKGDELIYIDKTSKSGNGCSDIWYKGQYGNNIGYVCSEFAYLKEVKEIDISDYQEYSDYLSDLGFPDSYITYLTKLHIEYPNWKFNPQKLNLDFNDIVSKEYDGYSKGWSLFEDTGRYYDGFKSTDSWSYNYLTDEFSNNFTGGGKYWFAANKKMIAYYLDPRNFLNNRQIFMFETLSYNSNYHTKEGIESMLKGTFMDNKYADEENKYTYADAFLTAGETYQISPYVLVSRVIQEIGSNGSTIVSGNVSGYEGYYNFYNIKAYGNSGDETITNGLIYAKECGWDNPYKAIIGGASFLSDGYISVGQDTLYLQKWDVIGPTYITHQYMQNIQAPATESIKTYNGYNLIGLVNSDFVFNIPIFNNMPDKTTLPDQGNPNNYLQSLAVNGEYLFKEATNQTNFSLNLDNSTKNVEISATKLNSHQTISGVGTVALNNNINEIEVVVRAENGSTRTYKINITLNDIKKALDISEILRVLNIKNDGEYIYGFNAGADLLEISKSITDKESKAEVKINSKNDNKLGTGDTITINTGREEKTYTFIVYGDVNGDSEIDKLDYLQILRDYYKYISLDGVYKEAADANKDGIIDKLDYLAVLRDYYGYAKIEQ